MTVRLESQVRLLLGVGRCEWNRTRIAILNREHAVEEAEEGGCSE